MIIAEIEYQPRLLHSVLEKVPEMQIYGMDFDILSENIRVIQWAEDGDFEDFEQAIKTAPEISDYSVLADQDDRKLYSLIYSIPLNESIYYKAAQYDFQLLESELTVDGGRLRCRIPSREALKEVMDKFKSQEYEFNLVRLYQPTDSSALVTGGPLTQRQQEVLLLAFENGYFEFPHEVTIKQLAKELEISDTAFSNHLWIGLQKIVAEWAKNRDKE